MSITALAVFGLCMLLRRNALTPRRLALFALFYALFAAGIVYLWQLGRL